MKDLDVNEMYKHDEEISPALKYCQPSMFINLEEFLRRRVG